MTYMDYMENHGGWSDIDPDITEEASEEINERAEELYNAFSALYSLIEDFGTDEDFKTADKYFNAWPTDRRVRDCETWGDWEVLEDDMVEMLDHMTDMVKDRQKELQERIAKLPTF